jgi:hypothetical protein
VAASYLSRNVPFDTAGDCRQVALSLLHTAAQSSPAQQHSSVSGAAAVDYRTHRQHSDSTAQYIAAAYTHCALADRLEMQSEILEIGTLEFQRIKIRKVTQTGGRA